MYYLGHLSKTIYRFSQSHRILGLSINCTLQQAKTAYYKKAHVFHPDKNPDAKAKEQFSQLNKAYEDVKEQIKKDVKQKTSKRAEATENQTKSSEYRQQTKSYKRFDEQFMEDLFEELRSRNRAERQQRKKQQQQAQEKKNKTKAKKTTKQSNTEKKAEQPDIHLKIELTPDQFNSGCIRDIKVQKSVQCECKKNGAPSCKICKGRGYRLQYIPGYGAVDEACIKCHGQGTIKYACRLCKGKGSIKKQFVQRVRVPGGSIPGSILSFKGKGQAVNGKIGDLNIKLMTKVNGQRKDNDFYTNAKISIAEAVLGSQISIETMYGQKILDIPRGTKHGQVLTIKGYGFETGKSGKSGNHYVTVLIDIPQNISQREQQLYEQLKQARRKRSQEY